MKYSVVLFLVFISRYALADIVSDDYTPPERIHKKDAKPVLVTYAPELKGVALYYKEYYNDKVKFILYEDSTVYYEEYKYEINKCVLPDGKVLLLNQRIDIGYGSTSGHYVLNFKNISGDTVNYTLEFKNYPIRPKILKQEIALPLWLSGFSLVIFIGWILYNRVKFV